MDKTKLIEYIKGLNLDPKLEGFLVKHVEESEINQELLTMVADILDLKADQLKIQGDLYTDIADKMDELQNSSEAMDETYKKKMDSLFDEFLTRVQATVNEGKTRTEIGGAETIPVVDVPVVETGTEPVPVVSADSSVSDLSSAVPVMPSAVPEPAVAGSAVTPVLTTTEPAASPAVEPSVPGQRMNSQNFEMDPTKNNGGYSY